MSRARDKQIRDAINAAGREHDQKALMIALTALRDITGFSEICEVHILAKDALDQIDVLSGNPFARIK